MNPTAPPPSSSSESPAPSPVSSVWWQQAVTYQVYIRSFADGDGDGTGDIAGLRSRLSYLRDLGVDALWINPWFVSPLNDGGYDVADYRDINHRYGDLDAAQEMIDEAHALGLRVLCDLVPNHTSNEHAWFQQALADGPGSAARSRYHFRPGRGPNGQEPPNNWDSVFGGIAWKRVDDGEWYLHLFDESQPDVNWSQAEVREEYLDILRFWFDRGVDGFRVDVAHALAKHPELPDVPDADAADFGEQVGGEHPFWDRDEVHDIIREWRALADGYDGDKVLVAEAWVAPDRLPNYLRPDQYHQSFNFDFLMAGWDATARREVIDRSVELMDEHGAVPTWVLSNHDVARHVSRFAMDGDVGRAIQVAGLPDDLDLELGLRRARAGALLMLSLPGSVYLYQGEELGLHEVTDLPEDVLDDPVWERSGRTLRGRDGCRVPIPWRRSGPSFGFGDGEPWLPQPASFGEVSVEAQTGVEGSTLELYRSALALRRARLTDSLAFEWLDLGDDVLGFRRGSVVSVTNFGDAPVDLPTGEILLRSDDTSASTAAADSTASTAAANSTVWIETP